MSALGAPGGNAPGGIFIVDHDNFSVKRPLVGLRSLRRGWLNMDLAWSLVVIASGAITLFTAL